MLFIGLIINGVLLSAILDATNEASCAPLIIKFRLYFSFNSINLRISEALCVLIINGKLSLVNLKRALTSLGCSSINSAIGEASINSAISASEDKSLIFIDDAKESKSSIIA